MLFVWFCILRFIHTTKISMSITLILKLLVSGNGYSLLWAELLIFWDVWFIKLVKYNNFIKSKNIRGLQGDLTSPSKRKSVLNIHWKDWCWSWNSNTLATWCKELTHLKRPWCWERLRAGGEGDDSGWDGWMASLTQWTWVCVDSGSWWWTGRPGMLWFMGSRRVRHDWATELNWWQTHS